LTQEERADFAAFLATLSPQQWQVPTLCACWRVRDVVAHVISYDDLGPAACWHLRSRAGSGSAKSTPRRAEMARIRQETGTAGTQAQSRRRQAEPG